MNEAINAGVRFFICEECGHEWLEASRYCFSPSGDHCEECGDFTPPDRAVKVLGVFFNTRGGVDHDRVIEIYIEQSASVNPILQ